VVKNNDARVLARDYLADLIRDEPCDANPGFDDWYEGVSEYLRSLPVEDPMCDALAVFLSPFAVEDDDRLEGTLYYSGEASWFLDNGDRGGDYRNYLENLLNGLQWDHERWREHVECAGDRKANWGIDGPPRVPSDLL
jgi:hypothetical protein